MKDILPLKHLQTRLHRGALPEERGNCNPTVLACLLHKEVEDVIQIQMFYDSDNWSEMLDDYLAEEGYRFGYWDNHLLDGTFYLVSGISPRNSNIYHVCIYQNGKLWHDPHPDQTGIVTEEDFRTLVKINL